MYFMVNTNGNQTSIKIKESRVALEVDVKNVITKK